MIDGTVPYPVGVDPTALARLSAELLAASRAVAQVEDRCATAAAYARGRWSGLAATTFVDHMRDRAHTLALASGHLKAGSSLFERWAAALRRNREWYDRYVETERALRNWPSPSSDDLMRAIAGQHRSVAHVARLAARFGGDLAGIGAELGERATRGFVAVGAKLDRDVSRSTLTGRALIADALAATEDDRIDRDEIQIRRLSDGSYIVVLPGVTDLSSLGGLLGDDSTDTVRLTGNAVPTALRDGAVNRYAEMVQMAMLRAGIPHGANVTLVGHSYGSYTSADLVNDDDFNSADGDGRGYHVNIRRNVSVAADVDWKIEDAPRETDVLVLNSRDDSVYQTEAQVDPELDWLWRRDRPLLWTLPDPLDPPGPVPGPRPGILPAPRPRLRPTTSSPSGHPNHVEREVSAGRGWNSHDKGSGHHPNRYVPLIRDASPGDRIRPIVDGTGDATVVETYNVRVPNRLPRP